MNFTLSILGTASALPFSDRNPSAQALSVHGRLFLIDCGEGTQQRMRQMHLSFLKLEAILISHIHGDHCFGLFGVLSTMGLYHRTAPLHVFGPQNLGPIIKFFLSYFGEGLDYEIVFHPVSVKEPAEITDASMPFSKTVRITAFPLNHKIDCYGYRFDEVVSPRRKPWTPRSYAYCSDTAPFPELAGWVKDVDLLYHEATYPSELEVKAVQYFHSTTEQAAHCALAANAKKLIIGHYSSRVRDLAVFRDECAAIFPESVAANDGDVFEIEYIRNV